MTGRSAPPPEAAVRAHPQTAQLTTGNDFYSRGTDGVSRIGGWQRATGECERVADGNVLAKAPAKDIVGRLWLVRYRWWLLMMPK